MSGVDVIILTVFAVMIVLTHVASYNYGYYKGEMRTKAGDGK